MSCNDIKILLSGLIDGELRSDDKKQVSDHLSACTNCRDEYAKLKKLKEVTDDMKYYDLPDRLLATYWQGIYNKIERGIGWIFLSLGAIVIFSLGAWELLNKFFLNDSYSFIIKFGVGALIFGLIVILVSIIRERLFSKKHDRYDEVEI